MKFPWASAAECPSLVLSPPWQVLLASDLLDTRGGGDRALPEDACARCK